jgi:chemotaxis-related protein WspB
VLLLLFHLDQTAYALDTARVLEVLPLCALRPVPHAPRAVAGVFDYRGRTLPVIDLAELLSGRPAVARLSTRLVVVEHPDAGGRERSVALMAERCTRMLTCQAADFRDAGVSLAGAAYLGSVASLEGELVQRIEIGRLLTAELSTALFERGAVSG